MTRAILAAPALAVIALLAITGLAAPPRPGAEAPMVNSLSALMQKEIHWGMPHKDVVDAYNKPTGVFDRDYAKQVAKLQPGVDQDELLSDRDSRKINFE